MSIGKDLPLMTVDYDNLVMGRVKVTDYGGGYASWSADRRNHHVMGRIDAVGRMNLMVEEEDARYEIDHSGTDANFSGENITGILFPHSMYLKRGNEPSETVAALQFADLQKTVHMPFLFNSWQRVGLAADATRGEWRWESPWDDVHTMRLDAYDYAQRANTDGTGRFTRVIRNGQSTLNWTSVIEFGKREFNERCEAQGGITLAQVWDMPLSGDLNNPYGDDWPAGLEILQFNPTGRTWRYVWQADNEIYQIGVTPANEHTDMAVGFSYARNNWRDYYAWHAEYNVTGYNEKCLWGNTGKKPAGDLDIWSRDLELTLEEGRWPGRHVRLEATTVPVGVALERYQMRTARLGNILGAQDPGNLATFRKPEENWSLIEDSGGWLKRGGALDGNSGYPGKTHLEARKVVLGIQNTQRIISWPEEGGMHVELDVLRERASLMQLQMQRDSVVVHNRQSKSTVVWDMPGKVN